MMVGRVQQSLGGAVRGALGGATMVLSLLGPCGPVAAQDAALVDAARKEGSLMLYSGFTEADNLAAAELFQKKYGIKVNVFRGDTNNVVARFDLEVKAGRVAVDVLALADVFVSADFQKKGLLLEYRPPATQEAGFDKRFAGSHYQNAGLTIWPAAWNTKLVTGEKVPRDYDAFLDPFWKGRLGMLDASTSLIGLQYYYLLRTAMGVDYMRKLGAQSFQFLSPNNAIAERVVVGEIYGAPFMILNVIDQFRQQGAPLAQGYMTAGTPVLARTLQVTKDARQPNAGKLFVNFLLTKEGQEGFQAVARSVSPRTDVTVKDLPSLAQVKALTIEDVDGFVGSQRALRTEFEQFFKGR